MLSKLSAEDRLALEQRYGLNGYGCDNDGNLLKPVLRVTAEETGRSVSSVFRQEKRAIAACRGEAPKKRGRKPADRVGQVFGSLTVVENLDKRGADYWFKCRGECGELVERSYRYLHRGGNGTRKAQCKSCAAESYAVPA